MALTRRRLLTAGTAGLCVLAGCTGGAPEDGGASGGETGVQSTFFVFDSLTRQVAGEAATAELLVPVGQHGHGWEPGPGVRQDIREAALLVHGMEGFQPWVDDVRADLEADGADVATVDVSEGLDLLEAGGGGHDGHDDHGDHGDGGREGDHDHGATDPHFWMDPLRVREAVGSVRGGLVDVDPDRAEAYAANAESYRADLEALHADLRRVVEAGSTDVLLVAGHDAMGYLADRYGVEVVALTGASPDDRPTARDIQRARSVIAEHDLSYVCADPLESQQAAEQLVAETDAEAVLPLTAMPGLTETWRAENWGYLEVMRNVNLPTLERALGGE